MNDYSPIRIWEYDKAPEPYRNLSREKGDYLIFLPRDVEFPHFVETSIFLCKVRTFGTENGIVLIVSEVT